MKLSLWCLVWGSVSLSTAFAQSASTTSHKRFSPRAYCEVSSYWFGILVQGFYVNPDGNLYSMQNQKGMDPPPLLTGKAQPQQKITEWMLDDYYGPAGKYVRQINPEEWQEKLKLLAEISKGQTPDFGGWSPEVINRCWVYNEKDKSYQNVVLSAVGGFLTGYVNSSPSTKDLNDWLESLRKETAPPKPKFGPPYPSDQRRQMIPDK
jgi:hypothetical protein